MSTKQKPVYFTILKGEEVVSKKLNTLQAGKKVITEYKKKDNIDNNYNGKRS